ncbi:magnesium/proton exchanger 1 isoform X3 [Physcomitrium patens]|uniref:magnesium/proton exchanger 1 isoform X3 n=1 Tax=Physcomitrium patens TaxID=3218 RepID=UPI000D15BAC9|nr:magnesium/proton exchanger 2-like isoform X3 [Physcomitrium patens]|eukprot:XP_024369000.1 magnesium/proton exchanger 2-like isoform X3 [Physcomitrella patens]
MLPSSVMAEPTWLHSSRAVLYAFCIIYCFVGLATITNLYMEAMEKIVHQTRKVVRHNYEIGSDEIVHERIWNLVIADITLLALGTSAPQISLAIIDAFQQLGQKTEAGLGPGTIIGSAAFNLYIILAVCVLVPKAGSTKHIRSIGVWIVELTWSMWAYIWLAIILQVSSPDVVEPWEAVCTVLQFPILMMHAYVQDVGLETLCCPSMIVSWKPIRKYFSLAIYDGEIHDQSASFSNLEVFSEQSTSDLERVDLQYLPMKEIRNGVTFDDHRISPFERQQVIGANDISEQLTCGSKNSESNQELVKLRSTNEIDEHTSGRTNACSLWKMQFLDAIFIEKHVDESGKDHSPIAVDCVGHLIILPWRFLFAFLPPPMLLNGWPAFMCALAFITVISCFLIKLANSFGCVTGVSDYVLALTILAVGTSWPDLIASKIAAKHLPTADSAIANINASNCINVYVGTGIPWLLQSFYNKLQLDEEFRVPSVGIGFSLMLFLVTFVLCQIVVVGRRFIFEGELGGPRKWAWASSFYFIFLWLIFVIFSCLRNYNLL